MKTALEGLGGIERFVKPGQVVAIKPNATWAYKPHTASATDPEFLRAMIQIVRDAGAKRIIVMDHCSIDPGTAEALRMNGIGKVVDEMKVEKVFPDRILAPRELYTRIDIPNGKAFPKIGVIKAAVEADVRINLAVAKTHNVTKNTMCLKHMMGFLEAPQSLHYNLEQGIADLSCPSPVQAQLHILEAIRVRLPYPDGWRVCAGPETDELYPNIVKRMNVVVAGTDPVLIDAYGCINFFNIKPEELTHLLRAYESGVGQIDVKRAADERRLRIYQVGQAILPPATPVPSSTPTPGTPKFTETPARQLTATPLPTAASSIQNAGYAAGRGEASGGAGGSEKEVVNLNRFLNGALLPVAAVVIGIGIAVSKRMGRKSRSGED